MSDRRPEYLAARPCARRGEPARARGTGATIHHCVLPRKRSFLLWPAEQFAEAEKPGKKIEKPGDVCFKHDVGTLSNGKREVKYFLAACT